MLGAIPTVIEPASRREPSVHPGPCETCTLFIAPPTTYGITNVGNTLLLTAAH